MLVRKNLFYSYRTIESLYNPKERNKQMPNFVIPYVLTVIVITAARMVAAILEEAYEKRVDRKKRNA